MVLPPLSTVALTPDLLCSLPKSPQNAPRASLQGTFPLYQAFWKQHLFPSAPFPYPHYLLQTGNENFRLGEEGGPWAREPLTKLSSHHLLSLHTWLALNCPIHSVLRKPSLMLLINPIKSPTPGGRQWVQTIRNKYLCKILKHMAPASGFRVYINKTWHSAELCNQILPPKVF